ncbi:N-acetylmuramic acid 6-phosphate etherase [Clostridium algidicarnis]|uniref:N-acetylmuramic acid 6-phosphate etherase n=1 Tax=Clostridium algidicarnis TaxID=37659 RepID=UPI001C0B229E|nr:N-acetylmuramic acid 6-phosphate etherase [Clostridium algidicarnis]MBU3227582.1 N-acetylmuramic acid 6-phosphate etherase [Clostridium algidicarnis]MBU3251012.1 N-acetylmuramic acid 6-phosphate etherase [Clostridium algidicarnis]
MDIKKLECLVTEERNINTMDIDRLSTLDMVKRINEEDKKVAEAVSKESEQIAKAIDIITEGIKKGGRLIYMGAGTSGRLGILDASECPPTFGVDFELIQGIIAGGKTAIFKAVEGAEDSMELGKKDLEDKNINENDVICGIAASGRTPYVIGGMNYAKSLGAKVLCVTMNPSSDMSKIAHVPISVVVGPEVIMGSTRMKAGTAQKMVLNMLTTGTMIKLGKVYSNLMVDVQSTNEKLITRAKRIVMLATGVSIEEAEKYLKETGYDVKLSILMIEINKGKEESEELLKDSEGYISKAIDLNNK